MYETEKNVFRFGDGCEVLSHEIVYLPASLGGKYVTIKACIVENDIPLLLSKDSMAKANMVLDFGNNRAKVLGKWLSLDQATNGHYMLPLTEVLCYDKESIVLHTSVDDLSDEQIDQKALKLHKQFGHWAKEPLIKC